MAAVEVTDSAMSEFNELPSVIQTRVLEIVARLSSWPAVSGSKPLRKELKGNFRIRTGDYRVIFRYEHDANRVTIWKIGYRGDIYE